MFRPDFHDLTAALKAEDQDIRIQSIRRLDQTQDPRVLDLLLDVAITDKFHKVRWETEDVLYALAKKPELTDYFVRRLIETDSIQQKELIARILQNFRALETVNALVEVAEKHRTNFRLRECTVLALLNFDRARATEYCKKAKINIVVADDEAGIRDIMCFTLELANLKVLSTNNGETAYELTTVSTPDLVLLDIRMPRMNGYEACRTIKANPEIHHIPVMFITAKGQAMEIQEGFEAGAEEYMVKPFDPDQLVHRIKSIIRKSRLGIYDNHTQL